MGDEDPAWPAVDSLQTLHSKQDTLYETELQLQQGMNSPSLCVVLEGGTLGKVNALRDGRRPQIHYPWDNGGGIPRSRVLVRGYVAKPPPIRPSWRGCAGGIRVLARG